MQNLSGNTLLAGFIILSVATLVLLGLVIWMYVKLRRFLVGIDSDHIGDSLSVVSSGLSDLQKFRGELESYLATVEKRLRRSVQSVHTVRYNPFKGAGEGGNQSFATAFLTEDGNGVVISSLHSRDHVRVFSKPVAAHKSEFELSDEEAQALKNASQLI